MTFEPVAIVGRACLLPGASTPEELFAAVREGRDLVSSAPEGRWGIAKERILTPDPSKSDDRAWSDRGGYVRGFESLWNPDGFAIDAARLAGLDELVLWLLHTAREAVRDAGGLRDPSRVSTIVGNLSFPSAGMARHAERVWLGDALADRVAVPATDPRNRFMSGLPAHLVAEALGLGGPAFALDAACASSLYAIALGCEALHDRRADAVLAGAVNHADDLFIHVGFCALGALSKTGRSRPFDRAADGLLPAEGAGFVVLKRLADAIADGDTIHGVIRGVGLSNDGRGRGMLAPSEAGQIRAMRSAYDAAGIDPRSVQYVECHATGTPVGDGTELRSMRAVFGDASQMPIGSLKANLGHLITVAGVGGLVKVLEAMKQGVVPPTPNITSPHDDLGAAGFRVPSSVEAWAPDANGVRRAGLSAFGFGGNNAHLVVESFDPMLAPTQPSPAPNAPIAVTGISLRVADLDSAAAVLDALRDGRSRVRPRADGTLSAHATDVALELTGLRFPPNDLTQALAQQTAILAATRDALDSLDVPMERTSILIGAQCDDEVARYGARWRTSEWTAHASFGEGWRDESREAFVPLLKSAGVLGTMPNIPANRLNSQFDLGGPSYTVASEELSGIRALEIGCRNLAAGQIDVAIVGAVDFVSEKVHESAIASLFGPTRRVAGDAAVVLVLERLDDARAKGRPILAVVESPTDAADAPHAILGVTPAGASLSPMFGDAHAATGLLHVAVAASMLDAGLLSVDGSVAERARVFVEALGQQRSLVCLRRDATAQTPTLARSLREPVLRFPAHPPVPSIATPIRVASSGADAPTPTPQLSATQSVATKVPMTMQSMAPAPTLPPTTQDHVHQPPVRPAQAMQATQAAHVEQPAHPAYAVTATGFAETDGSVAFAGNETFYAHLAALQAEQARAHSEFLASQSALHTQYLDLRQNAMLGLVQAAQSLGAFGGSTEIAFGELASSPMPSVAPQMPATIHVQASYSSPQPQIPAAATVARSEAVAVTRPAPAARSEAVAATVSVAATASVATTAAVSGSAKPRPQKLAISTKPVTGPTFDRAALEIHAGGTISEIFGPLFAQQDPHTVQVRMPEPPLLLADRVVGLDAVAGSMGKGTVWTETDITKDKWFLHDGYTPAGILIESGQADLFLISYLGVDFLNRGERAYRLLGCELTYHGNLPTIGETIRYDIHVDGHANHGDVRIFFFHYDCHANDGRRVISVREGQAGFFTKGELAESAGILWRPEEQELAKNARVDAPSASCAKTSFTRAELESFASGDAFACFGKGFEWSQTHNRAPRIANGRMLFQDAVTHFEPTGGPWGRGYLRATQAISPNDWFFDGHFKNDPCMPGTLMFEGCLGMMAFYLAGLGYTLRRDGWRFQPVTNEPYQLLCRGQVIPSSKELVYELFIEEVHEGPTPRLYADLLCTVDGLKAFHARRMGLELVPDWPLTSMPDVLDGYVEPKAVASTRDGFRFDYASLLACAWGKPSQAFGKMYEVFDGTRKVARLPGPPYHFMSRVTRTDGEVGVCKAGTVIEIEYDVPVEEWYFRENGYDSMPFCVFLEAALQPCGWLASYVGSAITVTDDLMFRNLDGDATFLAEVFPTSGTFRTVVKITNVSQSAGMIIESFDVDCFVGDQQVYDLKTVFGFFPKEAFDNQVGLPVSDRDRALFTSSSDFHVDLTTQPAKYCAGPIRLAQTMLLMIDRVTAFDPTGGKNGKGFLRAEKTVDPSEWFFKAHFFQDPVQPGSLGLEAMIQLMQFYMLEAGLADGIENPRFEPIAVGKKHTWKYRGQVVPKNELISSTVEILDVVHDDRGVLVMADASLWVDGKRIYEMKSLGMRIVSGGKGGPEPTLAPKGPSAGKKGPSLGKADSGSHAHARGPHRSVASSSSETVLDPARDTWLADHQPTFVVPALPMMSMVDRLLAISGASSLADVQVKRWLPVVGPVRTRARLDGDDTFVLEAFREARDPNLSRFEPVATARIGAPLEPSLLLPLVDGVVEGDPYASGALFHGAAFRYLTNLVFGSNGASYDLDGSLGAVPYGHAHQGLLDALTHGIPHDSLHRWSESIPTNLVAYPYRIPELTLHRLPRADAKVHVEVRFDGFDGNERFPAFRLEATESGAPLVSMRLVEILLPKGPIGSASAADRRAFLRDHVYIPGLALSDESAGVTTLSALAVRGSDWLPGTVARAFGARPDELVRDVAVKEHVARKHRTHPIAIEVLEDGAIDRSRPLEFHALEIDSASDRTVVRDAFPARFDTRVVREFWREWFGLGRWPVEDLYYPLVERFVGDVRVVDPLALDRIAGRPVLFLANHQTGIESLVFSIIASALVRTPTLTLAKIEHRESWLGRLIAHCFTYPGARDPGVIAHFDRTDPESLPRLVRSLGAGAATESKSLMVHVEGTRALSARQPIAKMSGIFADLAIGAGMPIVPVRFVRGLPIDPVSERLEFPVGFGRQDIVFGAPIDPRELAKSTYKARIEHLSSAIDALVPDLHAEMPAVPDESFATDVRATIDRTGAIEPYATILAVLDELRDVTPEIDAVRHTVHGAKTDLTPWAKGLVALLRAR